ncbi:MAG: hypothetical protein AB1700_21260, partial [Bacillota bacterium]
DAFWDWEPDYDDEPVPTSAYPDAKCLSCAQCGFYVDGADVANYLPEGIPIEDIVDYDDEYRDELCRAARACVCSCLRGPTSRST